MTVAKQRNPLTRKVGPLPVWAWAALALAAWFLYTSLGSSDAAAAGPSGDPHGSDAATASDLPVGGGGASGDAVHRQLAGSSALDTESSWGWDAGGGDDGTYSADVAPLAAKSSALTGQDYITYGDSSQPFAYGATPEQRPSADPAFGRSFYEGSLIIPSQPASNRPTAQPVSPAPVIAPVQSSGQPFIPSGSKAF